MPDMRFDPVAWAGQYGMAPYGRPIVTDIPGAGIDLRAMRRSGTSVPVWPAAEAGPTFVQYGRGAPAGGTLGLGIADIGIPWGKLAIGAGVLFAAWCLWNSRAFKLNRRSGRRRGRGQQRRRTARW